MQAIKPYAQIMDIDFGRNVLKKIELVGRTCYKSTDMIKEDSAEKFVANLIKRGHEAMVEHASFCFEIDRNVYHWVNGAIQYMSNQLGFRSYIRFTTDDRYLMSGNVRAWRDFFRSLDEWCGIPACFEGFKILLDTTVF